MTTALCDIDFDVIGLLKGGQVLVWRPNSKISAQWGGKMVNFLRIGILNIESAQVTMDMRVRRTAYDPKYEIDMKNLVLLGAVSNKFAKKQ